MKTKSVSTCSVRWACWGACLCLLATLLHAAEQPAAPAKAKTKAPPRPLTNEERIKRNEYVEKKAMEREKLQTQLLGEYVEKLQKSAQAAAKNPGSSKESRDAARSLIAKARILTAYHDAMKQRNEAYDKGDAALYTACSERMKKCQEEYAPEVGEEFPNFDAMLVKFLRERYEKAMAARQAKQKEAGGEK